MGYCSIGTLGLSTFASVLTIILYRPIATRLMQIAFLAWCAAMFYSNTSPTIVAQDLSVTRLPLTPIIACYNLGTTGTIDLYGFSMLLLTLVYIVALTFLTDFLLNRRDLILY